MKNCYSVTTYSVQSILGLIDSNSIAIPEIQRPFVWDSTKVRDLIDSLYNGYPTGYLITWKNPDVKIKGGGTAEGKTVLIDGQQRVTALMAALAGKTVLNDDYESRRIRIAFNPLYTEGESPFEVCNPAIEKDCRWIPDISELFKPSFDPWTFVTNYSNANPSCNPSMVNKHITNLKEIAGQQLGCIIVNANCTIDEVTNIFIRINSKRAALSQADFAMSKIAADELHGGAMLRKAIDYYCHLAAKPEFWSIVSTQDSEYMASEYASKTEWLRYGKDDIYNPDFNDMLRVAFMHKFHRGKLADLVSLLSGRDFEARDYKSEIADESYDLLRDGVIKFMQKSNFQDFVLALRSAGFISKSLIPSKGAVNFAYNLYLTLREDSSIPSTEVKRWVQRWYVMSVLTGRYSGSSESVMDRDIRSIAEQGFIPFYQDVITAELSDSFWTAALPQKLRTTSTRTGAWIVYVAAQIKNAEDTLFASGFKVSDLIATIGDIHHIFPKNYLKKEIDAPQREYNQIANYAYLERRINIKVKDDAPKTYFNTILNEIESGHSEYSNIQSKEELIANLEANCIPLNIFEMDAKDYSDFLIERRKLMAQKIRNYFNSL